MKSWTSTGYFSNSTGSFATSRRFSPNPWPNPCFHLRLLYKQIHCDSARLLRIYSVDNVVVVVTSININSTHNRNRSCIEGGGRIISLGLPRPKQQIVGFRAPRSTNIVDIVGCTRLTLVTKTNDICIIVYICCISFVHPSRLEGLRRMFFFFTTTKVHTKRRLLRQVQDWSQSTYLSALERKKASSHVSYKDQHLMVNPTLPTTI